MTQWSAGKGAAGNHCTQFTCDSFIAFNLAYFRICIKTSQVVRVGLAGLRTHSVCDGVCICVGNPGHFPLSCAHVWGWDVDARSWSGKRGGRGRKGGLIKWSTNLNFLISNSTKWVSVLTTQQLTDPQHLNEHYVVCRIQLTEEM